MRAISRPESWVMRHKPPGWSRLVSAKVVFGRTSSATRRRVRSPRDGPAAWNFRIGYMATSSLHPIYDPEHWRKRAEEMRSVADNMHDLVARASMLRIADEYEVLAKRAAERRLNRNGQT